MTAATFWKHWSDAPSEAWRWPHFTPSEMACRGSGELLIVPDHMDKLEAMRVALGFACPVNSGYRSKMYNRQVGGGRAHPTGQADDISVYGERAFKLMAAAPSFGFTGIGVSQRSSTSRADRFIHLDTLDAGPDLPRPRLWSY